MRKSTAWFLAWVSTNLFLAACGGDDAGSIESASALIGPAGGTLTLADGPKITIPEGALSTQIRIKITKLDPERLAPLPVHMARAGKPYAFEPHGQAFAEPVKIELPFEDSADQVRPMKLDDPEDTDWSTVFPSDKDSAGKILSFDVSSFSVYMAARPRRDSGVIVLPDGAIEDDASTPDASTPDAQTSDAQTSDAAADATIETDGGSDAMIADAGMDATLEDSGLDAAFEDSGADAGMRAPGRIVFVRETGNEPPTDLLSVLEDGTGVIPLADSADDEFFSGHGTRTILYGRRVGVQHDLYTIDVDGQNAHVLASRPEDEFAAFVAPDDRVIYRHIAGSENSDLYVVSPDGTGTLPLATTADDETFLALTSQGRVIYRRDSGLSSDIYSIGLDGSAPVPLAADASFNDVLVGVTPAGDVVYTSYDQFGAGGVYRISGSGGSAQTLGTATNFELSVAGITSVGVVLLRTQVGSNFDLFGPGMVPLSVTVDRDEYLASTSTGQVIFRIQDEGGRSDLFLINPDGTGRVTLAADAVASMDFLTVAPSNRVIYTDGTHLRAVDPDGMNNQAIALNSTNAWVSANNRVIYERNDGSTNSLHAVDLYGTNDTPLVTSGGSAFFVAWTLSGKVAFRREVGNADIYLVNDDGTNLIPIGMTGNSEYFQTIIEE